MLPVYRELGVAFALFSSLGRGFLTVAAAGREAIEHGGWLLENLRFTLENVVRNLEMLQAPPGASRVSRHGTRPGDARLGVMSRGLDVIPIPGMKRRAHLEVNIAAAGLRLDVEDLDRLDGAFTVGGVPGDRYTSEVARWVGP